MQRPLQYPYKTPTRPLQDPCKTPTRPLCDTSLCLHSKVHKGRLVLEMGWGEEEGGERNGGGWGMSGGQDGGV